MQTVGRIKAKSTPGAFSIILRGLGYKEEDSQERHSAQGGRWDVCHFIVEGQRRRTYRGQGRRLKETEVEAKKVL